MSANLPSVGTVQRKFLPCGVPIDPESCPCQNENVIPSSYSEDESVGKGNLETTSAGSCESINKLTTDDIEVSIYLNHVYSIFCRGLRKLELSASLHVLLLQPELQRVLNKEDFIKVMEAFDRYTGIEPCNWPCSESAEAPESLEEISKSNSSCSNLGKFDAKIHRGIEILNSYTEVREMVKQIRPEYSEQAQLFLGYIKYFIEHSLKRISMSPEECREKDLYYRKLWRDNEKAKMDLRSFTAVLDEQRKQHDLEMGLINAQCEKDLATVKRVDRKCKEDIKHTVIKAERKMTMMYKASEIRQKDIREDLASAESHLKAIRASNLALEKEARDKRFKIESQLLGVINKYDTEIGEQQKQMECLMAEFEEDKKRKEDLEAEIEKQAVIYNALAKERQEATDAILNEKLAKLILLRVVRCIQRWWRKILEQRRVNIIDKKKKKKNTKTKKKK